MYSTNVNLVTPICGRQLDTNTSRLSKPGPARFPYFTIANLPIIFFEPRVVASSTLTEYM